MQRVSVIIPTYNRREFLRRAIRSVIQQTYAPIELIVVDDASAESVDSLVTDMAEHACYKTKVVRHADNAGAAAARNTGIRAASGDIVAFLDDDDRWLRGAVDRYVSAFQRLGSDIGLVSLGARNVDETGEVIGTVHAEFDRDPLISMAKGAGAGSFSRFAVRREVIEAAGLPDADMPCWQDREWQFRLAQCTDFHAVSDILVERTIGEHKQLSDQYTARRDTAFPRLIERNRPVMAAKGRQVERTFLATSTRSLAFSALQSGEYAEAIRWLGRSLRWDPTAPRSYVFMGMALGGPATRGLATKVARQFNLG